MTEKRRIPMERLFYSNGIFCKMGSIPSMLCQTQLVKGFMGQTTSFDSALIKSNVLIMEVVNLMAKHVIFTVKRQRNVYFFWRS
jgi:hypothetical protein